MGSATSIVTKPKTSNDLTRQQFEETYVTSKRKYLFTDNSDGNKRFTHNSSGNTYYDINNVNNEKVNNWDYAEIESKQSSNSFDSDDSSETFGDDMVRITRTSSLLQQDQDNNKNCIMDNSSLSSTGCNNCNNIRANITSPKKLKRSRSLKNWQKSFSRENSTSDPKHPVIVRHDSARFHKSNAPGGSCVFIIQTIYLFILWTLLFINVDIMQYNNMLRSFYEFKKCLSKTFKNITLSLL